MVAYLALLAWTFFANAVSTAPDPNWWPAITLADDFTARGPWLPAPGMALLLLLLLPALLLAAALAAGRYRPAYRAAVSLLFACIIALLWAAVARREIIAWGPHSAGSGFIWHERIVYITSARGGIQVASVRARVPAGTAADAEWLYGGDEILEPNLPKSDYAPGDLFWPRLLGPLGLEFADASVSLPPLDYRCISITVPYWLLLLFCTPAPAHWLYHRLRPRAADLPGHCPTCGYDLRAHKPGDKCPECGTRISSEIKTDATADKRR